MDTIFGIISLSVGIFILGAAFLKQYNKIILKKNSACVQGVLCNYKVDQSHSSNNLYAGIYEYYVNGIRYEVVEDVYSSVRKKLGTKKKVYYAKDNPSEAIIESASAFIFLGLAGIIFFGVGFALIMANA